MFYLEVDTFIRASLVFLRITGLFFGLPFFGDLVIPVQVRILCAGALALGIYPLVPISWGHNFDLSVLGISGMMLRELLIGLSVGYLGKLIFEGIVMAASLVGYQMGFGTANLLMPGSDVQINAFTALHRIIVLLFFLSLSLHYIFINGIIQSFEIIPAGSSIITPALGATMLKSSAQIFSTALQLSAPILVALLFTMSALGLMARTVPQMNVFTLSFPISFFVGLAIYAAMSPFLPEWLNVYYKNQAIGFLNALFMLAK
ncbi:MAG: flagellar biosynthetic protein FliR [Oligoflexales bacterium]